MDRIKLYLDDERTAPNGWVNIKSAEMAIQLLKKGVVEELSLDHDLGRKKTGYDVLLWIEKEMLTQGFSMPNAIYIHTANPVGRMKMEQAISSITRRMNN
ncbi:MAG: hypothetical protein J7L15_08395 [Clostridiales bacterium]|nr:hypothetical protein [Clostridiales bacterium]